jgi:SOS response regulatory protein OraA/RecX
VPTITSLRERGGSHVAIELDGAPWRTIPVDVVIRAGLRVGLELDRERARALRRELRRSEAVVRAQRALAARDRSARELEARLERAGFAADERREALARLERAGHVDDERLARARAAALAARGWGNEAIRHDLDRRGVAAELIGRALGAIEAESERAGRLVVARGAGPGTARYLARRGFGAEAIEAAAALVANEW